MNDDVNHEREKSIAWILLIIATVITVSGSIFWWWPLPSATQPMIGTTVKGSDGSTLTIAPTQGTTKVKGSNGSTLEVGFSQFGPALKPKPKKKPATSPVHRYSKPIRVNKGEDKVIQVNGVCTSDCTNSECENGQDTVKLTLDGIKITPKPTKVKGQDK